jgi:hypothetical protein
MHQCGSADFDCAAELRESLATTIPSLIKLLRDKVKDVRGETVKLIGNLANHGEWQLGSFAAHLMRIAKSNFGKPS